MKASLPVILVGTHLLALGAGWWCLGPSDPAPGASQQALLASKQLDRSPRQERRVSAEDLLAAYETSSMWIESQKRRSGASQAPIASANGSSTIHIPPEQRAAEVTDIAGAMQKELEAVDAGKSYDYQLAQALVARWMKEGPAACAAWLGQMKMRTAWGDPFHAFAKTLPPAELLKLMEQGWLQRNRRFALEYLAQRMGEASAADLPAVLAALGQDEAKGFLEKASGQAKAEDAAVWLELLGGDPKTLRSLANRWIQGPGSSWAWNDGAWVPSGRATAEWQQKAELVLASAAGTPAEEIFRHQLEAEQERSDKGRELARIAREPAEATAALVDFYVRQGHDEAEARGLASQAIAESYGNGLDAWQRDAWEQDLQLSLLGRQRLNDVLIARLKAIDAELPQVLHGGTRSQVWSDAMVIDPEVTLEVARQSGRADEALQSAAKLILNGEVSLAKRADILLTLSEQEMWKQDGELLPNAQTFSEQYLRDDPEAARLWIAKLPPALSQSLKKETR
jgi:hypothetical protein